MKSRANPTKADKFHRLIAYLGLGCGSLMIVLLLISTSMVRSNPMDFRQALGFYQYGVFASIAGILIGVVCLVFSVKRRTPRKLFISIVVLALCLPVLIASLMMKSRAEKFPKIHDITTDTENPPQFQALVRLREGTAVNAIEYGGPDIAALQKEAYPEIQPYVTSHSLTESYEKALAAAEQMNWKIVSQNRESGIIEATATTAFFGFKDDIVIRLSEDAGKTKIDIRSLSRVGISDVGANAKRINRYMKKLKALTEPK